MTANVAPRAIRVHQLSGVRSSWRRSLSTPKGLLTIVLLVLLVIAGRVAGPARVWPAAASALLTAIAIDLPMLRWRRGAWRYPAGGVLTALLVTMIVSVVEPWYVVALGTATGLMAKHLLRSKTGPLFNPAALGLVAAFYGFDAAEDWWGALTAIVPGAALPVVIAAGAFVAYRVKKLALALAFLIAFFAVVSAAAFVVDPADVADVFIWPDLLAMIFAAGFIVTDPPTSPPRAAAQLWTGTAIGLAAATLFVIVGRADYLLEAVLIGNAIEALRRWHSARRTVDVQALVARIRPRPA